MRGCACASQPWGPAGRRSLRSGASSASCGLTWMLGDSSRWAGRGAAPPAGRVGTRGALRRRERSAPALCPALPSRAHSPGHLGEGAGGQGQGPATGRRRGVGVGAGPVPEEAWLPPRWAGQVCGWKRGWSGVKRSPPEPAGGLTPGAQWALRWWRDRLQAPCLEGGVPGWFRTGAAALLNASWMDPPIMDYGDP